MGRVSTNAGKDPYLRKGFWEDPKNHFWNEPGRTIMFAKEKYVQQFKLLQNEKNEPGENSR